MGDAILASLRVKFDRRLKLEFHGRDISFDGGGRLPCRELGNALGVTDLGEGHLAIGCDVAHRHFNIVVQGLLSRSRFRLRWLAGAVWESPVLRTAPRRTIAGRVGEGDWGASLRRRPGARREAIRNAITGVMALPTMQNCCQMVLCATKFYIHRDVGLARTRRATIGPLWQEI